MAYILPFFENAYRKKNPNTITNVKLPLTQGQDHEHHLTTSPLVLSNAIHVRCEFILR